jgi:hypothetical protein
MFEQVFDSYRKAVEASFKMQQEMFQQWLNGWPGQVQGNAHGRSIGSLDDQIRSYQKQWSETVRATLDKHRESLNAQYRSGIEAIESAFRTTEAHTPEEYWRLTQEFWRKSIDSFKLAFESQVKYLERVTDMWFQLVAKRKS